MTIIVKQEAIAALQDPFGKTWRVDPNPRTALYRAVTVDDETGDGIAPAPAPKELVGTFTNRMNADKAVYMYLDRAWREAEVAAKKREGKAKVDTTKKVKEEG